MQRQDTDERLRRLQTDKESLALQVQVLSEQVSAQNEKISDMERLISDKSQLISNTESLLQRVSSIKLFFSISKCRSWTKFSFEFIVLFESLGNAVTFIIGNTKVRIDVSHERIEIATNRIGTREFGIASHTFEQ